MPAVLASSASSAQITRVRHRVAVALELLDLDDHLVERRLHGFEAGRREVREVAFRRRARDVERGHRRANRFERRARRFDERFVLVGAHAQRRRGLVGLLHVLRSASSARMSASSCASPAMIAARRSSTRRRVSSQLGGERDGADFELCAGFLEARHFTGQTARAFDEAGVRGARFGRPLAEVLGGLARLEQAPLRRSQAVVGRLLVTFKPRNRHARFALTPVDGLALFLRLPALHRQLLELLRDARRFVAGLLQPRFVRDDRFFLLVMFGVERRDRVRRVRDRRLERRRSPPASR